MKCNYCETTDRKDFTELKDLCFYCNKWLQDRTKHTLQLAKATASRSIKFHKRTIYELDFSLFLRKKNVAYLAERKLRKEK